MFGQPAYLLNKKTSRFVLVPTAYNVLIAYNAKNVAIIRNDTPMQLSLSTSQSAGSDLQHVTIL